MQFETTYANTEAHQQSRNVQLKKKYFRKLTELIHDADYIYIAGPGKTKNELKNLIEKEAFLNGKITHVDATGELTRKQVIALVNDYFSGGRFKIKERVLT